MGDGEEPEHTTKFQHIQGCTLSYRLEDWNEEALHDVKYA